MDLFTISSPLILSCCLRIKFGGSSAVSLADNLVVIILISLKPSLWTTIAVSLPIFIAVAVYETQAEYGNLEEKVRETFQDVAGDPQHSLGSKLPLQSPPTSNAGLGMCPMNFSSFLGSKSLSSHPKLLIADTAERKVIQKTCGEVQDPKEIYGKPILFPCTLNHRRFWPFKDDFRHSYLYAGAPVGLHTSYSPLLSVDHSFPRNRKWPFRKTWFAIRSQDVALRGRSFMTLNQKLREYLLSEGYDPNEWAYAYILVAPTTIGECGNPLSYWYLYSADKKLTAVIVETLSLEFQAKGPYSFRGHFGKDIFVSPFNPRAGRYTVDTSDPCASPTQLDILITIAREEGGPRIVTRVTSTEPSLDVSTASLREKATFLARWFWVPMNMVISFRILSQAARIYIKGGQTLDRPEAVRTNIGRAARVVEIKLERNFRLLLKSVVESHPVPIIITYKTPGEHSPKSETFQSGATSEKKTSFTTVELPPSPSDSETEVTPLNIVLQVISPTFYSRFFHYNSPSAALTGELLDEESTRTLWSSDPTLLTSIFETSSIARSASEKPPSFPKGSSKWQWQLLSYLRIPPLTINSLRRIQYQPFKGLSSMDYWSIEHLSSEEVKDYRRTILRVFLGEWVGGAVFPLTIFFEDTEIFGLSRDGVLRIYDAIFKAALVAACVKVMGMFGTECESWAVGAVGWISAGVNVWDCFKASL